MHVFASEVKYQHQLLDLLSELEFLPEMMQNMNPEDCFLMSISHLFHTR